MLGFELPEYPRGRKPTAGRRREAVALWGLESEEPPREVGDCGSMFSHGEELEGRESVGVVIEQGG